MTTPTRIATFLFQSALCLGLVAGPAFAGQKDVKTQSDARTLTRDRGTAEHVSSAQPAAKASASHTAKTGSHAAHNKSSHSVAAKETATKTEASKTGAAKTVPSSTKAHASAHQASGGKSTTHSNSM
ncbi:hypothetical protein [Bordetella genomosp. 4]|uniref:Acid-shock protein n=1 Tax=Bordetella genomosp. 4 TaxID=463044 RepID=A0A261TYQ4_9BORD|nr:hypothetical protein [Bordetella genomosp. 4]OZI47114.1 hypothetical protein CAL21_13860 [Bordetella genomosp. 4]OZI54292.1 hypothetical protein CAL20_17540 [Bordetella genomosp. 4]